MHHLYERTSLTQAVYMLNMGSLDRITLVFASNWCGAGAGCALVGLA